MRPLWHWYVVSMQWLDDFLHKEQFQTMTLLDENVDDMNRCEESRMLMTEISLFWYYLHKVDECSFFMNSIFFKISSFKVSLELEI